MLEDLARQISAFAPLDMHQLEYFIAEVERRLAMLSDERMVLKGFDVWPERRLEAMREAVGRKAELEKITRSMDPESSEWRARGSVVEELEQVIPLVVIVRGSVLGLGLVAAIGTVIVIAMSHTTIYESRLTQTKQVIDCFNNAKHKLEQYLREADGFQKLLLAQSVWSSYSRFANP